MVLYIYHSLIIVSTVVQLVLLIFLLQGPFRKFPVLFIYLVADLASTVVETLADSFYNVGRESPFYLLLFWSDEIALDLLLFLLVIVLTYQATEGSPVRAMTGRLLGGVVLAVLLLPFVLFPRPFTSPWFNSTSELLNFGGAIMNLFLWTALIGSRRRDQLLLTVSAGLGVVVTGAAISFGLRHLITQRELWIPNMFLLLTHLTGLAIWCWAFRPAAKKPSAPPDAVTNL